MDWYSPLLIIFLFCMSYIILDFMRIFKEKATLPPGPFPLPFIGNFLQLKIKEHAKSLLELTDKYGPVYTLYLGTKPAIVISGYSAIKEALIDQSEVFGDRADIPVFQRFIGDKDFATWNGDRWKILRRFSVLTLRNFGMGKRSIEERIQEEAHFLIQEFAKTKGALVNPKKYFAYTSSNVISSVVFGSRFEYEDKRLQTIADSIIESFHIMSTLWGMLYNVCPSLMEYVPGPHTKIGKYFQKTYDVIYESIKQHMEILDPENPGDYIDCFLIKIREEKDKPSTFFNRESLAGSIQDLVFGGTETISANLTYGFLVLMKYPEIADKVQEEIDRIVGRDRLPSVADKTKMPYTEATINELMRFCDILPINFPHQTTRDTTFRGYHIPKGTSVILLLSSVHSDPNYYADPKTFNPNHFLDENGLFKKNDALLPFSAGKRACPGESLARMELFLFFTSLLQNFKFKPVIPKEEIDVTPIESALGNIPPAYECYIIPRSPDHLQSDT
ncbi:cytochrome P450 2F2-like isoform X2 [Hyperolius riggenbachi]|uniref:cytochrome P450 2F2-like isoform X2 n=1 Tax=Hyperolius riggenbachi TaxID=752182 RepID=UPI0035A2C9BA